MWGGKKGVQAKPDAFFLCSRMLTACCVYWSGFVW